jgi:putative endonuclease
MKANKTYYTYMLANHDNTMLYVGITNNIARRVQEHKIKLNAGYASKLNIDKLVYFECYQWVEDAIKREKQIKSYRREKKNNLINAKNPSWEELKAPLY